LSLAQVRSAVVSGVSGTIVTVEVDVAQGLPTVGLVGLADASIGEARHRARCAVGNTRLRWPLGRVTIGLSPAHVRKHGTGLDLPIAIGVLSADEQIPLMSNDDDQPVLVGELGLDGAVRPIPGAITVTCAVQQAGFRRIVVPAENVQECARVPGIEVIGARNLLQAVHVLLGEDDGIRASLSGVRAVSAGGPDLSDVLGQSEARRALEIAAAGRHSLAMVGPPGVGKTLLAERLPGILPDLSAEHMVDVMAVHALVSSTDSCLVTGEDGRPPFQSPHHSSSPAALLGSVVAGGVRPGAVSLAHRGVLFLDEAPEFARNSLESLRQPVESGFVNLHRAGWNGEVPADFQLVLAANPCPCGYRHTPRDFGRHCDCPRTSLLAYAQRLSGPLLDRIDIRVRLQPVRGAERGETSAEVADRVLAARDRALRRWHCANARVSAAELVEHRMERGAQDAIADYLRRSGGLRSTQRITKVAWTLADLDGRDRPNALHVREAIDWHQPLGDEAE
jgi:magnesium chelatase family protein